MLLAKTEAGYRNLMRLASRAYLETEQGDEPHVTLDALAADAEALIALTGGPDGALDRAFALGRPEQARARLATLERFFDDRLYVEIQRHGLPQEREIEPQLLDLAYRRGAAARCDERALFRLSRPISRRMTRCSASQRGR